MSSAARSLLVFRALRLLLTGFFVAALAFLPFAGRFLARQDALEPADLIFVLGGARAERWLEAVELYKEGWAPRIVLSPGAIDPVEVKLRERGVVLPREGDVAHQAALALGVPSDAISVLAENVDNTADEAAALRRLLERSPLGRIIVVTSGYHIRRAGFAFRREFADTPVRVIVRGSRHSTTRPPTWWRSRSDIRQMMSELPKMAAYVAGLGR